MKHKFTLSIIVLILVQVTAQSQVWEWGRNAGNFYPLTDNNNAVPNSGVCADQYGNVYSLGSFKDTLRLEDTIIVSRIADTITRNEFMVKYNKFGNRQWVKVFPHCAGAASARATSHIRIDQHGDIIFSGYAYAAFNGQALNGNYFICKMQENGTILWVRQFQNEASFTINSSGEIFVAFYNWNFDPNPGFGSLPINNINEACLGKLNADGTAAWLKEFPYNNFYNFRPTIELNPSETELLTGFRFSGTINFDGTTITLPTSPIEHGAALLSRFSVTDGASLKNIVVTNSGSNGFFYYGAAQWITDSTMIFCLGDNYSSGIYNVGANSFNINDNSPYQQIILATIDTAGNVKWNRHIKGALSVAGYNATDASAILVKDGSIYIGGEIMPDAVIEGNTVTGSNISMGLVARYDTAGNYKAYTTGGGYGSITNINTLVSGADNKIYFGASQLEWSPFPTAYSAFGADTLTTQGMQQFYVGKMEGNSNIVTGKIYADMDNDNSFSAGDHPVHNALVRLMPVASISTSNSSGDYSVAASTGNYDIATYANIPLYYTLTPPNYTGSFSTFQNYLGGQDFRLEPTPGINDLDIQITRISRARPGGKVYYMVTYKNKGTTSQAGQYSFKFDSQLQFYSSDSIPSAILTDSLVFNYSLLQPFESGKNIIAFSIPTTVPFSTELQNNAHIYPIVTDNTATDNSTNDFTKVVASYDPNNKVVLPVNGMRIDTAQAGLKYIDYTINFQNTGTDTALNVVLLDTLPQLLDLSSIMLVSSSHVFDLEVKGERTLSFSFPNINLPDSNVSESKSHGFIRFFIKPRTSVTVLDTIYNKGFIYFDYNTPVETNTVNTYFWAQVVPLSLISFDATKQTNDVKLQWKTAFEQQVSRFEIEKSNKGIRFSKIATVAAKNFSTGAYYEMPDQQPFKGMNYYRLKMVNEDGNFSYSETRKVNFAVDVKLEITPNPSSKEIHYSIDDVTSKSNAVVSVYDMHGKIVITKKTAPGNSINGVLNIEQLQPAIYILKITADGISYKAAFEKL